MPGFEQRICGLAHIAEHFNPQLYFFYQKGSSGLRRLKRLGNQSRAAEILGILSIIQFAIFNSPINRNLRFATTGSSGLGEHS